MTRREDAVAYHLIAGTSTPISRDVDVFGEHRFFGSTDVTLKNVGVRPNIEIGDFRPDVNNLFLGTRVRR